MNYDEFGMLWHEALDAAGLLPHPLWPTEAILAWDAPGMGAVSLTRDAARKALRHRLFHAGAAWPECRPLVAIPSA